MRREVDSSTQPSHGLAIALLVQRGFLFLDRFAVLIAVALVVIVVCSRRG